MMMLSRCVAATFLLLVSLKSLNSSKVILFRCDSFHDESDVPPTAETTQDQISSKVMLFSTEHLAKCWTASQHNSSTNQLRSGRKSERIDTLNSQTLAVRRSRLSRGFWSFCSYYVCMLSSGWRDLPIQESLLLLLSMSIRWLDGRVSVYMIK